MCALIPYQGQGQRSMSRSLPSKIVKTLPVLTKCFHFLFTSDLFEEKIHKPRTWSFCGLPNIFHSKSHFGVSTFLNPTF